MKTLHPDQVVIDSKEYVYRGGHWTTPSGYLVSTSHGQVLTVAFFERNGRVPGVPAQALVSPAPRRLRVVRP